MDTTTKLKVGFAALMILSGIGVASYPVISNAVAQRHASEAIQNYDDTVKSMDTEKLDAAKEAARRYNQQLDSAVERDAAGEAEDTGTSYVDLVDVGESLGYITIPKIDVNLPIYEGTSDDVLQKGVGHLEGSSYPLGGESTHSVLTGHRGLPEAVLFTDLDKLEEGDCFYLHILDETLAYQVDQIKVVEPEHTEDLEITAGQDYCTLVTCTPYAINTHRMLVRGTRIPYNGEEETNTPQAVQYQALRTGTVVKRVVDAWPWIAVTGSIVIGGEALLLLLLLHITLPVAVNIRCGVDGVDKAVDQVLFAAQLDAGINGPVDGSQDALVLAVRFMVLHDQHQNVVNVNFDLPNQLHLEHHIIRDILFGFIVLLVTPFIPQILIAAQIVL